MVNKKRFRKDPEKWRNYNILYYHNWARKLREKFNNQCFICSHDYQKHYLVFHEINWLPHSNQREFLIGNFSRFILLCIKCHHGVHWLHDEFNFEIEDILRLIELNRTPKPAS